MSEKETILLDATMAGSIQGKMIALTGLVLECKDGGTFRWPSSWLSDHIIIPNGHELIIRREPTGRVIVAIRKCGLDVD